MWRWLQPRPGNLRVWQFGLLVALFVFWHLMTKPGLVPPPPMETNDGISRSLRFVPSS